MSAQTVAPQGRAANIFINYRREDSSGHAGRLFDALSSRFPGRLFMDIDTLQPGVDFVDAIEQAVAVCDVLLVVIGREWLTVKNAAGKRRLDDPADFVRLELESALARSIRIIPVLVQDAPMPAAEELPPSLAKLARRNAIELSDARWAYDVHRLADTLQEILGEKDAPAPPPDASVTDDGAARRRVWLLSLGALAVVAAAVLGSVHWLRPTPARPNGLEANPHLQDRRTHLGEVAVLGTEATAHDSRTSIGDLTGPIADPKGMSLTGKGMQGTEVPTSLETTSPPPPRKRKVSTDSHVDKARKVTKVPVDDLAERSSFLEVVPPPPPPTPRVMITAPAAGATVGSTVQVQGSVEGLGEQRIFLCIRQPDGRIYPRGELFPKDGGQWTIQLRSSKEKSFDILVVASRGKEASQALSDQTSRDNGLSPLPAGAAITGVPVSVQRKRTLFGID